MSELRWNWVYFPYLDAPNKQEESALKAGYIKVVSKDEADKVITDLEESHKMEVEQLLMEIVELKAQKAQAEDDCAYWKMSEGNAVNAMHETEEYAMQLYKELRRQKFKRCLDKAEMCKAMYDKEDTSVNGHYSSWEYISDEMKYWERWQRRWLKLAEQFKEADDV